MFGVFRPTSVSLGGLLWYGCLALKIHAFYLFLDPGKHLGSCR